uniref:SXP/RAL-2 family protein Ani s 5-like cation-binding domain-containing protein n=1 Tax=Panagrellus redivivus TaxID=6233 RepID=A0A7E4ZSB2_PANRE
MRLFALCVTTAIVAVGFTQKSPNSTAAGYFDATFILQDALMEYGAYSIATVRNLTTPTPSSDPHRRNYTTLTNLINFAKPQYDEDVQRGLEKILRDVFASKNTSVIDEFTPLIYDSLVLIGYVKIDYQEILDILHDLYVKPQSAKPDFIIPFALLSTFYRVNDEAFTRWAKALETLGTPTSEGLDRFRAREKVSEKVYKKYHDIAFGIVPEDK